MNRLKAQKGAFGPLKISIGLIVVIVFLVLLLKGKGKEEEKVPEIKKHKTFSGETLSDIIKKRKKTEEELDSYSELPDKTNNENINDNFNKDNYSKPPEQYVPDVGTYEPNDPYVENYGDSNSYEYEEEMLPESTSEDEPEETQDFEILE